MGVVAALARRELVGKCCCRRPVVSQRFLDSIERYLQNQVLNDGGDDCIVYDSIDVIDTLGDDVIMGPRYTDYVGERSEYADVDITTRAMTPSTLERVLSFGMFPLLYVCEIASTDGAVFTVTADDIEYASDEHGVIDARALQHIFPSLSAERFHYEYPGRRGVCALRGDFKCNFRIDGPSSSSSSSPPPPFAVVFRGLGIIRYTSVVAEAEAEDDTDSTPLRIDILNRFRVPATGRDDKDYSYIIWMQIMRLYGCTNGRRFVV